MTEFSYNFDMWISSVSLSICCFIFLKSLLSKKDFVLFKLFFLKRVVVDLDLWSLPVQACIAFFVVSVCNLFVIGNEVLEWYSGRIYIQRWLIIRTFVQYTGSANCKNGWYLKCCVSRYIDWQY